MMLLFYMYFFADNIGVETEWNMRVGRMWGKKCRKKKRWKGGKGGYRRMYNDEKLKRVDDC